MPLCGGCLPDVGKLAAEIRSTCDLEETIEFISKVPVFKPIPPELLPGLARAFSEREYRDGDNIITQGDAGDEMFVIRRGQAAVLVDGNRVNTLSKGDFFGELAMLHGTPRNATIAATEGSVQCLGITREEFNKLDLRKKLEFKKRKGLRMDEDLPCLREKTSKTQEEKDFIKKGFMSDFFIGSNFKNMTEEQLEEICKAAYTESVAAGTELITQGDKQANFFYILQRGSAIAIKDGVQVAHYKDGGSFGGLALVVQETRAATIKMMSQSTVWTIPRSAMRSVLRQHVESEVAGYKKFLEKVNLFDKMSEQEKQLLADALMETTYAKGQVVTKQGEARDAFYILVDGIVSEVENGVEKACLRASIEDQDDTFDSEAINEPRVRARRSTLAAFDKNEHLPFFGLREVMEETPYFFTRTVVSEKANFLVLRREILQRVLARNEDSEVEHKGRREYKLSELSSKGLLGCGGFGKVTLELDKSTGQVFALKKISKGFLVEKNQTVQVMNEKRILRMCHSRFLVQGAAFFNDDQYLYFLLEPALGGELYEVYNLNDFHGRDDLARFYSACVIKGLEHLHERCIIYRDMKPENLLLDSKGYCKITDFGLAKFCIGKTFTTCGTPEYFAPEMIKTVGHTTALDWWTVGILIYELMMGGPPFLGKDLGAIMNKTLKGINACPLPRTRSWAQLVKELLRPEPSERLPVQPGGVKNLANHKWYKDAEFDFSRLASGKMIPPFIPEVADDATNFNASEEDAPEVVKYIDKGDGWDKDFADAWGPPSFEPESSSPEDDSDRAFDMMQKNKQSKDLRTEDAPQRRKTEKEIEAELWGRAVGA